MICCRPQSRHLPLTQFLSLGPRSSPRKALDSVDSFDKQRLTVGLSRDRRFSGISRRLSTPFSTLHLFLSRAREGGHFEIPGNRTGDSIWRRPIPDRRFRNGTSRLLYLVPPANDFQERLWMALSAPPLTHRIPLSAGCDTRRLYMYICKWNHPVDNLLFPP